MVEREKTGLDKDLNSNPYHLISALSRVRVPPTAFAAFDVFRVANQPYCGKISLEKDFDSNPKVAIRRFESCPGKAAKEKNVGGVL